MTSAPSSPFPSVKPGEIRHIDLTRSLPSLDASLSPAAEFSTVGRWLFLAFLLIHLGLLLACYAL